MPQTKRNPTRHPGVTYTLSRSASGKPEKVFYIRYRNKDKKLIEEKAGRQFRDKMTEAQAARLRADRIEGELSNAERRAAEAAKRAEEFDRVTISRLWTEYVKNNPGLKGLVTDRNRFEKHIKPVFGSREPHELAPLDVDRLRISLLKHRSPATVKNVLELLRRLINFGVKKRLSSRPAFIIEMPKVNNEKTEDLTGEELRRLLNVIDQDVHPFAGPMMKLALYSGMRRGEMFRLQWKHVNFETDSILLVDPKGGIDQRIPLNDAARGLLEKLKSNAADGAVYVFPGRQGEQRTDIKKSVNRIKRAAGLPASFRALHGLRHVFASTLANSGRVDQYTLQKLMTHKSPKMTARYSHLRDETLRAASAVAADIFSDAEKRDDGIIDLSGHAK